MHELPLQTLLQQAHAKPISGEDLEVFGKKAAARWRSGECVTLSHAVVETVKQAGLSPEQVKRVVEFCNQDAFLEEFRKEGSEHRYISFDGGPADPSVVIKDLNDGGGGTVFDRGRLDYTHEPDCLRKAASSSMDKTASAQEKKAHPLAHYEDKMYEMLGSGKEEPIPYADPTLPLRELQQKLASAKDQIVGEISNLELEFSESNDRLFQHVKQACLSGTSLSHVVQALASIQPDPTLVKVAFQSLTPKLVESRVFPSLEALGASLQQKLASGSVDSSHPIVEEFGCFCETLNKIASHRQVLFDVEDGLQKTEALLKEAVGGLAGKAWKAVGAAGDVAGKGVGSAAEWLVGADPNAVGEATKKVVQGGSLLGGALVGNAALQQATENPVAQRFGGAAKAVIPGTNEYNHRLYRIRTGQ